ncbi:MAG: Serine acetyltransferase [Syntrophorhabdaceae bacterium PtaU1.Bin034]|nr:MAG: Serine acetyltransferase [Syntrophorhabdaceae bacterium PtaU1.Bin034]
MKNENHHSFDISEVVERLCDKDSYLPVYHGINFYRVSMPSTAVLAKVVDLLKSVLFPGFFINTEIKPDTMKFYVGFALDEATRLLQEQVRLGYCFSCVEVNELECLDHESEYREITSRFIATLPHVRRMLSLDAQAAYRGDPAATSTGEVIFCYPSMTAITHHRLAHELYKLNVPLIPRIISEMAHSTTGIDIHPGATIGESFFADHGTGTVIGETTIIGNNVRLYQGVTLGAKSFEADQSGNLKKGIPRHPIVEDDVVIYSGATILGRITIGKGSQIGGNVWLTESVPPKSRIVQHRPLPITFENGSGI